MAVGALSVVSRAAPPATGFVPGGRFRMGAEDGCPDERPVHEAEVRPLRFARTPVSNAEYAVFLETGAAVAPPWWHDPLFFDPRQPVVGVTWLEAIAYCAWLGAIFGGHWRLPTEAEWEHAFAGDAVSLVTAQRPGAGMDCAAPPRLGGGAPNLNGLFDPGTAVQEWCLDWYAPDAYRFTRRYDPRGPETGQRRARRGGGFRGQASHSARFAAEPRNRAADAGFRPVREVP